MRESPPKIDPSSPKPVVYWNDSSGQHVRAEIETTMSWVTWSSTSDERVRVSDAEGPANAEFIAEAFTVAHETGLTPRQMAERIADWR